MPRTQISIVAPVYNCANCLAELVNRVRATVQSISADYQLVLVDDRSNDDSWSIISDICRDDPRVVGIRLSRNFGQMRAIAAGLQHARGQQIIVMDADLQDPPEKIPELLRNLEGGNDIVFVRRVTRRDGWFKRLTSKTFFWLMNRLSSGFVETGVGTFSSLSRRAVDGYLQIVEEKSHYLATLAWLGYKHTILDIPQQQRFAGKSSYTLKRLFRHAIDGIVYQSTKLLHMSIAAGFLFALIAIAQLIWIVYQRMVNQSNVPGWASLMVTVWFVGGAILFSLGVLGLYIERIIDTTRHRPLFLVDQALNASDTAFGNSS